MKLPILVWIIKKIKSFGNFYLFFFSRKFLVLKYKMYIDFFFLSCILQTDILPINISWCHVIFHGNLARVYFYFFPGKIIRSKDFKNFGNLVTFCSQILNNLRSPANNAWKHESVCLFFKVFVLNNLKQTFNHV